MIIILAGSIGRFPIGGNAWCEMQYLLGLSALGHDVFYLEECGDESWVYNWEAEQLTTDLDYPTTYVRDCLEPVGLGNRWIYRAGECAVGMALDEFLDVCSQADLLIVHGGPIVLWRSEYERPRRRIFVDLDPGFIQISLINGHPALASTIARCEHLFTIGQRIGALDCPIPTVNRHWRKTVPPISLPHWPVAENGAASHFTSVMQWRSYREVVYEGVSYGNKDREFPKFTNLPCHTEQRFRLALTGAYPEELVQKGWEVVPGWIPSRSPWSYRTFIQESRAEFNVAKQGYVLTRGGWFSDRTVCYLASGRPALVQDTGLRDWLPTGEGLLTFRDVSEALNGIEAINADYERHRHAARQLAEHYFAAERVLPPLLEAAMM
ncbi:MAG TPA: hypothetical protein VLA19_31435 [Herpetosiphonaceae bacterium]|nr:hypothetical protein [Herpetosiphonaceae bacterium]